MISTKIPYPVMDGHRVKCQENHSSRLQLRNRQSDQDLMKKYSRAWIRDLRDNHFLSRLELILDARTNPTEVHRPGLTKDPSKLIMNSVKSLQTKKCLRTRVLRIRDPPITTVNTLQLPLKTR